jgi:hypothetical protein
MRKPLLHERLRTVSLQIPEILFEKAKRTANEESVNVTDLLVRAIIIGVKEIQEVSKRGGGSITDRDV